MLRRSVLVGVLLALVGLGAQQSRGAASHPRNGRITYTHADDRPNTLEQIYTTNAAGTHRRRLTNSHKLNSFLPSYSPNGKRIVFVRCPGYCHHADLWTMRSDGTRERPLTYTGGRANDTDPRWSPNGTEIVFTHSSPKAAGIFAIGIDGGDRRQLTSGADWSPSWSPDGSEIAFSRYNEDDSTERTSIFVVPASGGTPTDLSSAPPGFDDTQPAWSPDGSRILFVSSRTKDTDSCAIWPIGLCQWDVWVMNADGSNVRRVTHTRNDDEDDPVWSPDGRWIAYGTVSSPPDHLDGQLYVRRLGTSRRAIRWHACGQCANNWEPSWQPLP